MSLVDRTIVAVLRAGQSHGGTLRPRIRSLIVPVLLVVVLVLVAGAVAKPSPHCSSACIQRVQARLVTTHRRHTVAPYRAFFERVARCESGGDWQINTGNGYYGGIQFSLPSWQAVGGRGLPSRASKLEQMFRGVRLLRLQGRGAWPACGRR